MTFQKIYVLLLFLGIAFFCHSQGKKELDNSVTKEVSEIYKFNTNISNYLLINQIESNRGLGTAEMQNPNNIVKIEQIGNNNTASITVSNSNKFRSNVFQEGNRNVIESSSFNENATENLVQSGNNNRITNFSFGNVTNSSLNLLQNGNNHIIERFGTNSLTEKLSIRVNGESQTVIIRSF